MPGLQDTHQTRSDRGEEQSLLPEMPKLDC
jgi:hypothetical protein